MSTSPDGKRRNTGPLILAILIVLLLAAEAAVLIAVFASPETSKSLSNKLGEMQAAWEGTEQSPGVKERTSKELNQFYDEQIKTLWSAPTPGPTEPTFAKCVSCHPNYMTDRRFNNVYMNHPLHDQQGMECADCHTMVQHPNPTSPTEKVCQECHEQVSQKNSCDYCHFPGSLPHFYLLGYPRNSAVDCSTCHPKDSFKGSDPQHLVHPGEFLGGQKQECLGCHEFKTSNDYTKPACLDCHAMDHPPDWVHTHGIATGVAFEGQGECAGCHPTPNWCATQCHPYESPAPQFPMPKEVPSP